MKDGLGLCFKKVDKYRHLRFSMDSRCGAPWWKGPIETLAGTKTFLSSILISFGALKMVMDEPKASNFPSMEERRDSS